MNARHARAVGVCAALALLGGGCGSSGPNFAAQVSAAVPVLTQLNNSVADALGSAPGKTDAVIEAQFTSLSKQFDQELARLAPLTPPRADATSFATLTNGLRAVRSDLTAIAAAAHKHSVADARNATLGLLTATAKLRGATGALAGELHLH